MPALQFDGRLESDQGACFIRVPPQTLTALGEGKRVPLKGILNGYTYRTTIAVYGGKSYIGVRRAGRESAGRAAGVPSPVGPGCGSRDLAGALPPGRSRGLAAG